MAINTCFEQYNRFELQMPASTIVNTGDVILFGQGTHVMVGIAQTAQVANLALATPYDDNSGFVTVQVTGAFNLSVKGQTQKSPSAGAAINPGDPIFADGGLFDKATGITTGSVLDADTNGTFIGLAMDPVAAGATTTIRVILKNTP